MLASRFAGNFIVNLLGIWEIVPDKEEDLLALILLVVCATTLGTTPPLLILSLHVILLSPLVLQKQLTTLLLMRTTLHKLNNDKHQTRKTNTVRLLNANKRDSHL